MRVADFDEAAAIDACIDGDCESVRRIFGRRWANQPVCDGQLPLHLAAAAGNLRAIAQLFELGASLNATGTGSLSVNGALHLAVLAQQHAAVSLLLTLGAEVDVLNGVQTAPLQDAARLNDIRSGYMLLEAGANPGRQNGYGNTVLHRVCYFGHQAWLAWLGRLMPTRTWADLAKIRNTSDLNALDVAISHDRREMVRYLEKRGLQRSKPLHRLCGLRYSERRQWLGILTADQGQRSTPGQKSEPKTGAAEAR